MKEIAFHVKDLSFAKIKAIDFLDDIVFKSIRRIDDKYLVLFSSGFSYYIGLFDMNFNILKYKKVIISSNYKPCGIYKVENNLFLCFCQYHKDNIRSYIIIFDLKKFKARRKRIFIPETYSFFIYNNQLHILYSNVSESEESVILAVVDNEKMEIVEKIKINGSLKYGDINLRNSKLVCLIEESLLTSKLYSIDLEKYEYRYIQVTRNSKRLIIDNDKIIVIIRDFDKIEDRVEIYNIFTLEHINRFKLNEGSWVLDLTSSFIFQNHLFVKGSRDSWFYYNLNTGEVNEIEIWSEVIFCSCSQNETRLKSMRKLVPMNEKYVIFEDPFERLCYENNNFIVKRINHRRLIGISFCCIDDYTIAYYRDAQTGKLKMTIIDFIECKETDLFTLETGIHSMTRFENILVLNTYSNEYPVIVLEYIINR